MYFERTIKKKIIFEDNSLYSNVLNKVICYPAEEYTGIYINNVLDKK